MKVAFVTGASRGIGRAIAKKLARADYAVACAARVLPDLEQVAAGIRERGGRAVALELDVRDPASCARAAEHAIGELGPVDLLVNNAGVGSFAEVHEMPTEEWERVLRTNLDGAFHVTRTLLPAMIERGSGHIVNIASIAGWRGFRTGAAYAASKFGLVGFNECLALECRPHGVRVTLISPGSVSSHFQYSPNSSDWKLEPEDVADAVAYAVTTRPDALVDHVMLRPLHPPSS
ncbi:MAG: SDR family oxidoreductase [Planctomycetota bacterium]